MAPGGAAASDDPDGLLAALDDADAALRAVYRQLAGNPDLAAENESKLRELHAKRLDLAQRVGLSVLARSRASAQVKEAQPTPPPAVAEPNSVRDDANGSTIATESKPKATSDESPASAPASDAQLAEWKSTVRSNGLGAGLKAAPSTTTAWPLVMHELMELAGVPRNLDASVEIVEEVGALDDVAADGNQEKWAWLPKNAQQLWLSMLVARTT